MGMELKHQSPVLEAIIVYKIPFPCWGVVWFLSLLSELSHNHLLFLVVISKNSSFVLFCITVCSQPRTSEKMIFFFPRISHGVLTNKHGLVSSPNISVYFSSSTSMGEPSWINQVWIEKLWWNQSFYQVHRGQCGAFDEFWSAWAVFILSELQGTGRAASSACVWSATSCPKHFQTSPAPLREEQERGTGIPSSWNSTWRGCREKILPLLSWKRGGSWCDLAELPEQITNPIPGREWPRCAHHPLASAGKMDQECWKNGSEMLEKWIRNPGMGTKV